MTLECGVNEQICQLDAMKHLPTGLTVYTLPFIKNLALNKSRNFRIENALFCYRAFFVFICSAVILVNAVLVVTKLFT